MHAGTGAFTRRVEARERGASVVVGPYTSTDIVSGWDHRYLIGSRIDALVAATLQNGGKALLQSRSRDVSGIEPDV
jgi:hypothetical protein